ncbi:HDOD domain-containing protein [Megalodesulfovibrio paquesii]
MLLRAGETLTERSLRVMRIWGVTEAQVAGHGEDPSSLICSDRDFATLDPRLVEVARCHVTERFRHMNTTLPPVRELMRAAIRRVAMRYALTGPPTDLPLGDIKGTRTIDSRGTRTARDSIFPNNDRTAGEVTPGNWVKVDPARFVRDDLSLGSLPQIFQRLVQVINDDHSSAADVAEIITTDTDLAARVLRVVNSPLYGLSSRIDTVSRAVAILGEGQLTSLAMSVCVVSTFKGIPARVVNMRDFWRHSLACAIGARLLANMLHLRQAEQLFVAGLLHDIGRLALYKLAPEQARQAIAHAHAEGILLRTAEKRCLGFTHDILGGLLLEAWLLPPLLVNSVRCHHDLEHADAFKEAACVHVADCMANALELGGSGDHCLTPLDMAAWKTLGLTTTCLRETMQQMERQVEDVFRFFLEDL